MELRTALKEQYHAGLEMLAECVEKCPDELWIAGRPPRSFWRIVYHAAFFTQLYLGQDESVFRPWPGCHPGAENLFTDPANLEPYELPDETEPYTRQEMLDYIVFVDALVDPLIDALDLDLVD